MPEMLDNCRLPITENYKIRAEYCKSRVTKLSSICIRKKNVYSNTAARGKLNAALDARQKETTC